MFKWCKKLAEAIVLLAQEISISTELRKQELSWFKSQLESSVTKEDLKQMEKRIVMKLSEVKATVAAAAKQNAEAFAEVGSKIADLQKRIDELIDGAGDPDVTDEAFIADLNALKTNAQQLADIVPNAPAPAPES